MKSVKEVRAYIAENPLFIPINNSERKWESGVLAYANDLLDLFAEDAYLPEDQFYLNHVFLDGASSWDDYADRRHGVCLKDEVDIAARMLTPLDLEIAAEDGFDQLSSRWHSLRDTESDAISDARRLIWKAVNTRTAHKPSDHLI